MLFFLNVLFFKIWLLKTEREREREEGGRESPPLFNKDIFNQEIPQAFPLKLRISQGVLYSFIIPCFPYVKYYNNIIRENVIQNIIKKILEKSSKY